MSLLSPIFSFLSIKPTCSSDETYLLASTGRLHRALSLFSYDRRLLIDKESRMIRLNVRKWWLFQRITELSFDRVKGIIYGYQDFGTSWSVNLFWIGRTDSVEMFYVTLALVNPEEKLPLFTFFGEGSTETGLSGVILGGDDIVDFRGAQEHDSRGFVGLVSEAIGVNIISD